MPTQSLLSYVRSEVTVDVDSMDPSVASRHTSAADQFCDMTSNQAIVYGELTRPEQRHVLDAVLQQLVTGPLRESGDLLDALDLATVLLAKEVLPHLRGRVHAQTSPSVAYSTAQTVKHAQRLVALFEANGVPRSRVCIKIPATPESIVACYQLERGGIRTLATCLFSVSQAVAASQAGCLYVAPYFNELRVHFQPNLWKEYENTVQEHPMSPVIMDIVRVFKEIDSKTLVMPASIVTAKEVLALTSLHPDHLTLSGAVLDQLGSMSHPVVTDASKQREGKSQHTAISLAKQSVQMEKDGTTRHTYQMDFLANGAEVLRKAINGDSETLRKVNDALKIFDEMEEKTKEYIRHCRKQ